VHQTEIHAKLISIMGDRLTAHIESLKARIFSCLTAPSRDTDGEFEHYFVLIFVIK
jgi:hypothetical protein